MEVEKILNQKNSLSLLLNLCYYGRQDGYKFRKNIRKTNDEFKQLDRKLYFRQNFANLSNYLQPLLKAGIIESKLITEPYNKYKETTLRAWRIKKTRKAMLCLLAAFSGRGILKDAAAEEEYFSAFMESKFKSDNPSLLIDVQNYLKEVTEKVNKEPILWLERQLNQHKQLSKWHKQQAQEIKKQLEKLKK